MQLHASVGAMRTLEQDPGIGKAVRGGRGGSPRGDLGAGKEKGSARRAEGSSLGPQAWRVSERRPGCSEQGAVAGMRDHKGL